MDDDLMEPETERVEPVIHLKKPKKIKIPKRKPSLEIPTRKIIYVTADKTTCEFCECFPKESPWLPPDKVKRHPCMVTPWKLYDYAAYEVEKLLYPSAFNWSPGQVATWMADYLKFPQYVNCILDNKINGRRLLMLEDPSHLARINIKYFEHQKKITESIHLLFRTEYLYFKRSIGLPRRKLLALLNWFKSRTGPTWGIRQNWTRADVLRAMQIIGPKPVYMNHWDIVWYQKPDFEKTLFGRIPPRESENNIPECFTSYEEICREYTAPRLFRFETNIKESDQFIWMEHRPESDPNMAVDWYEVLRNRKQIKEKVYPGSRLCTKPPSLKGKRGRELLLAKRLIPKKKFAIDVGPIPANV